VPPLPVLPLYLDLPLMSGDEVPHAPHIAVTADPWPGGAAVYRSFTDSDFALLNVIAQRATIGRTRRVLHRAAAGRLDLGAGLEVTLTSGSLSAIDDVALLSGGNLAAIGDGTPDGWEIFQFGEAELVADKTYRLSKRLRGQLGTDAFMPEIWPEGSWFVLLNGAASQMALSRNERGVRQTLRVGPSSRPVDDPVFQEAELAFSGNGLRPYAPVHLTREAAQTGDIIFRWIRRTRIDGDSWDGLDVPLAEEAELYLVRILKDSTVIREEMVQAPLWTYGAVEQATDGLAAPYEVEVAQVSASFGPGAAARATFAA
jgi:hypothetical protein